MTDQSAPVARPSGPGSLLVLAFKALMWLNGLGAACVIAVALGVISFALSSYWLRLPLALFLAGIMLSALGLLWSGLTQGSLVRQALSGRARRTHWLPALFATISYALAFIVFAAGCWALVGVVSMSQFYGDTHTGIEQGRPPTFQHPQDWSVDQVSGVMFRQINSMDILPTLSNEVLRANPINI